MLTEICQYLKNWFNRKPDGGNYPKYEGTFTITDGHISSLELADGQYYRIIGSLYNDGVRLYPNDLLTDETFTGEVWQMGVPPEVVNLATDISAWRDKYEAVDSEAMSPYQSESFGGYSYSKASGGVGANGAGTWQSVFSARLDIWRKI